MIRSLVSRGVNAQLNGSLSTTGRSLDCRVYSSTEGVKSFTYEIGEYLYTREL